MSLCTSVTPVRLTVIVLPAKVGASGDGSGSARHARIATDEIVTEREDKRLSAGSVTAFYPGSARERQINIEVSRAAMRLA